MSSSSNDTVYLDERWLLMRWDSEHKCLLAEWKGFATSAEFRGALLKAIDVIRDRNGAGFVTDTRKLELVSDDDQRWLMSTWPPLAIAAGLKRLAIVLAKTGLSKMAVEDMIKAGAAQAEREPAAGDPAFQSRTFESVAEAVQWVTAS
ncbi:MAG TPA: hypothetical protein VG426_04260 [Candidatus Dormibacteraeota bacterium]|jgi:hypothetical protein|nr:hypothetical protein [Candidatus Dormibacteraeota bacterium]